MWSKDPPRVSVAEVAITVASPNSLAARASPIASGETRRRTEPGSPTAYVALATVGTRSSDAACPTSVSDCRARSRCALAASSRSPRSRPSSAAAAPQDASTRARTSRAGSGSTRSHPGAVPASSPSSASAAPCSRSRVAGVSASGAAPTALRRSERLSSWVSASVAEATNSCASSSTTTSCSGSTLTSVNTCSASSAWLATTRSASLAASRACSAKQSTRSGQRRPRQSRADTDTCRQARSVTGNGTSSRSPEVVSSAQARSRSTCCSSPDGSVSNSPAGSATAPGPPCTCCRHR